MARLSAQIRPHIPQPFARPLTSTPHHHSVQASLLLVEVLLLVVILPLSSLPSRLASLQVCFPAPMPAFMPTILQPPLYSSVPLAAALEKAFKEHENDASTVLAPTEQQYERLAED